MSEIDRPMELASKIMRMDRTELVEFIGLLVGEYHAEKRAKEKLQAKLDLAIEALTYIKNGQTRMYLAIQFATAALEKIKGMR